LVGLIGFGLYSISSSGGRDPSKSRDGLYVIWSFGVVRDPVSRAVLESFVQKRRREDCLHFFRYPVEKSVTCLGSLVGLCEGDAVWRLPNQHVFPDGISFLDCQGTEVVVGGGSIVFDDPYHLLCLFDQIELPISRRPLGVLREGDGFF
jgi:hypothetical protein